ncbi:hypothetical protein [Paenibacillus agricola]|uniref:Beta-hexosaminidase bacterial type N-terminal domain-containing protein n=1 Tax=Paenibacillus agricola TaxID=2716264 RepID=A0ABX0JDU7_9BACL|nr:hypothetical protein [Paenibacillus agricola]NHN33042.1 hypothetical protein [Paenibacillus agricola]
MKPITGVTVNIVSDASDLIVSSDSASWAVSHLTEVLTKKGLNVSDADKGTEAGAKTIQIRVCGAGSAGAQQAAQASGIPLPTDAEAFSIVNVGEAITVIGADANGLVYGLLELADRVTYSEEPEVTLRAVESYSEKPHNKVRSINRLYVSEVEDKPWFYDKAFWDEYLTELASQRFNRLHLALGMGYDYGHNPDVKDNYFCFAYPYLLNVPGYDVRVTELPVGEMERNLETLQYIAKEAKRRGFHFQLGIWTHAYVQEDSPDSNYKIAGVDDSNHAAYCRDALQLLLETCPDIDGVTIRTHYEGGIPEPAHLFWEVVMAGVTACGRPVEIDMHTKGVDDQMLQIFLDTGMPIVLSPKFWAEHMGLPYHQAAIRPWELPVAKTDRPDLMSITATYRRFTRYGYGDYLKEGRSYGVLHRIWPGTQRVLLWGDPAMAAGYSRRGSFGGSIGIELSEPLAFKGRKGSGVAGERDPYQDISLQLDGQEWRKYLYYYRLWGRLLYNPDTQPEVWQRLLRHQFKAAAADCEQALAHAGRILPLVTTAHLPSAANNVYWPEIYTDQSIVFTGKPSPYDFDSPAPKTFGAVSPLDSALFYRIDDFVEDCLNNQRNGRISPLEVADRLTKLAETAEQYLIASASLIEDAADSSYRRLAVDVAVQAGLGKFFAHKMRSAVAYSWHERTGSQERLAEALDSYRLAKAAWEQIVADTQGVYRDQQAYGYLALMRGSWADRLELIEEHIGLMEQVYANAQAGAEPAGTEVAAGGANESVGTHAHASGAASSPSAIVSPEEFIPAAASIQEEESKTAVKGDYPNALSYADIFPSAHGASDRATLSHKSPQFFRRGDSVEIRAKLSGLSEGVVVKLLYRQVHQAKAYETVEMSSNGSELTATIPGVYTDSVYPLAYYFELHNSQGQAWLAPGFDADLSNQPYYDIRQQV